MVKFRVRINEHFIRNMFHTVPCSSHFVNLYLNVRAVPNSYNNKTLTLNNIKRKYKIVFSDPVYFTWLMRSTPD